MDFKTRYGEWAFVAGGSSGMGGEFSSYLATKGMNVALTGRRAEKVEEKCRMLEDEFGIQTRGIALDLGDLDAPGAVAAATEGLEIGFLVYNAGLAGMQPFQQLELEREMYRLNVNVRSMLALTILFGQPMVSRKRGGIILLSSYGGIVGTPFIQTYSATKAYGLTLAEALWAELMDSNVDVMAVMPGNTIGESFSDVAPGTPGFQTGREVVEEAFGYFGQGPTLLTSTDSKEQMGKYFDPDLRREGILLMKQTFVDMLAQYGVNE